MNRKIVATVLLVIGAVLLYFAYQASQSLGDQVSEAFTGRFTDSTIWYLIIGAAAVVGGLGMLLIGRSTSR